MFGMNMMCSIFKSKVDKLDRRDEMYKRVKLIGRRRRG